MSTAQFTALARRCWVRAVVVAVVGLGAAYAGGGLWGPSFVCGWNYVLLVPFFVFCVCVDATFLARFPRTRAHLPYLILAATRSRGEIKGARHYSRFSAT